MTLYAYGLEARILLAASGAARGWRALLWRPSALLAAATVAAGVGMNGGLWRLFHVPPAFPGNALGRAARLDRLAGLPHGFIGRLFGVGAGQWGDWLLYQGALVAIIVVALVTLLVGSPVNRRALALLAVPFALGAVIYLCSLISPPLPTSVGNTLVAVPLLLILLAAMALSLWHTRRAGSRCPRPPGGAWGRLTSPRAITPCPRTKARRIHLSRRRGRGLGMTSPCDHGRTAVGAVKPHDHDKAVPPEHDVATIVPGALECAVRLASAGR